MADTARIESFICCLHTEQECQALIRYAQTGYIGRIRRRLNEPEKNQIRPGSIFIYMEQESGIRRWTDKREWTPSRVQGIFLIYRELNGPMLKKTYCIDLLNGRYRIVAYTLYDWESNGHCCYFFNKSSVVHGIVPQLQASRNPCDAALWGTSCSRCTGAYPGRSGWNPSAGKDAFSRANEASGPNESSICLNEILAGRSLAHDPRGEEERSFGN